MSNTSLLIVHGVKSTLKKLINCCHMPENLLCGCFISCMFKVTLLKFQQLQIFAVRDIQSTLVYIYICTKHLPFLCNHSKLLMSRCTAICVCIRLYTSMQVVYWCVMYVHVCVLVCNVCTCSVLIVYVHVHD